MYVFNSESDLLVPQLMSQLVLRYELHNDLVYGCTDICETCICLLNALMCTHASAIILMWKRELVVFLSLSSYCLVIVVWHFLHVPWVCLQFVIVVFPDHAHYF